MSKFHNKENIFATEIVLKVEDLNRSLEFYKSIMGFKVLEERLEEMVLTANGKEPIVTLISSDSIVPKVPRRAGIYHFAVLLPNRHQLGLFLKNLKAQQYPIVGGSHHGVSEAVYLQDPDDNGIEVYADTQESTWDRDEDTINMVTERLNYDELIESTGDSNWEGAPEDTIMGHIHLHVADLDEALKFYNELGFELTQKMRNSAYFVSTGGYHHHIGFNIWNGRGSEPLPENSAGMKYYTLKFPDEKIRYEKINNLKRKGYEVIEIPDGIFTKDPSQNMIKLIF